MDPPGAEPIGSPGERSEPMDRSWIRQDRSRSEPLGSDRSRWIDHGSPRSGADGSITDPPGLERSEPIGAPGERSGALGLSAAPLSDGSRIRQERSRSGADRSDRSRSGALGLSAAPLSDRSWIRQDRSDRSPWGAIGSRWIDHGSPRIGAIGSPGAFWGSCRIMPIWFNSPYFRNALILNHIRNNTPY